MKSNKSTDTVQDIEGKMQAELLIIKDPKVAVEIKKKAAKKVNFYMNHLENVDSKQINGKTYNERMYHSDTKPMNKEDIFKLIDSVNKEDRNFYYIVKEDIDLSGVFVTKE